MEFNRSFVRLQAYAGERSCFQSIAMYNNQLVLLGRKGVHVVTVRTWGEVSAGLQNSC